MLEFKSSKYLSDYAEENGFRVKKGVAEIPTAFVAEYGSGRPIIGILGEFDANPGISQKKQPIKEPLIKGAAGHAVQCFNIAENIDETVSLLWWSF